VEQLSLLIGVEQIQPERAYFFARLPCNADEFNALFTYRFHRIHGYNCV